MHYELSPQNTVMVCGPASVILLSGQATILGAPLRPHGTKTILRQRQMPIETGTHAELEITGDSARILHAHTSTIPHSWKLAAVALKQMLEGAAVILGPPDVGKSTLCVYLLNTLLQDGKHVCVIDADIGQTDIGPPTTIARAIPTRPILSLQELTPDRAFFIGHISPSGVEPKLINGIQRLLAKREKSITIINTDGWITSLDATVYKIDMLTQVKPDLVLGLGFSNELDPILDAVTQRSLKITAAKHALERSRVDRRRMRSEGYRRFLHGAVTRLMNPENAKFSFPPGLGTDTTLKLSALKNLIVGILNSQGYLTQIGILESINRDHAFIYSRHTEAFDKIDVGYVKLSTSGNEIGFLE